MRNSVRTNVEVKKATEPENDDKVILRTGQWTVTQILATHDYSDWQQGGYTC